MHLSPLLLPIFAALSSAAFITTDKVRDMEPAAAMETSTAQTVTQTQTSGAAGGMAGVPLVLVMGILTMGMGMVVLGT